MNILTAEESFLQTTGYHMNHKDIKQAMIEFAKLHVKTALEAASNSTDIYDFQEEIKNAYPLTNIK